MLIDEDIIIDEVIPNIKNGERYLSTVSSDIDNLYSYLPDDFEYKSYVNGCKELINYWHNEITVVREKLNEITGLVLDAEFGFDHKSVLAQGKGPLRTPTDYVDNVKILL